eukprot:COSAG01_NODE_1023_length_12063_cov_25.977432_14_plen_81_part_00
MGADGAPREGAGQITASGTYWLSAAPMAAALATLKLLEAGAGTSFARKFLPPVRPARARGQYGCSSPRQPIETDALWIRR